MTRILFYAMGGGYGHARRAVNLIHALRGRPLEFECLVLCPDRCVFLFEGLSATRSPDCCNRDELAEWFQSCLNLFEPDLVVVDTFPRGVMGELRFDPYQKRVLLTRRIPVEYYRKPEVLRAIQEFDQVFWCEPGCRGDFPGLEVEPVVDSRTPPKVEARAGVLGLGTGIYSKKSELKAVFEQTFPHDGRWRDRDDWIPDLSLELGRYRLVICGAGYNTFYELASTGTPAILVPQARLYDDQRQRVEYYCRNHPHSGFRLLEGKYEVSVLRSFARELNTYFEPVLFRGAEAIVECLLGAVV